MELRQLRYFVVTAETGNLSKASKLLYLSQPGLSKSITTLEQSLGVQLFDRTGGKFRLLPAGEYLLQEAKPLLAQAQRVEEAVALCHPFHYALDIGIEERVAESWSEECTRGLQALKANFPEHFIRTQSISSENVKDATNPLSRFDLVLAMRHQENPDALPYQRTVGRDQIGLLCHRNNLPEADDLPALCRFLEQTPLIFLDDCPSIRPHFMAICQQLGCQPSHAHVVSRNIARILISVQNEVLVLPQRLEKQLISPELSFLSLPSPLAQLEVSALWQESLDPQLVDIFCQAFCGVGEFAP
jgi:DNA-binding transcriptional LysR family regulator